MHAPDGFLNAGTAVATGAISAGAIGVGLRQAREQLADRQVPLAGISAAFIFAAQMFNFPVAAGTTGHLLGGALAAILLGPAVGSVVVAVVVIVQALLFADGGVSALGYNVLNMAVVTAFGGYAVFRGLLRLLPRTATGVVFASGIAAGVSVVLSATAFSLEWLFGATFPVPFDTVFGAMVGVHLLIGIGEGVLTGLTVGAVLAARPDLVAGVHDLDRVALRDRASIGMRGFLLAGALVALLLATVVSQFAAPAPDGLERVAEDTGIAEVARDHALADAPFADYATHGLRNESLSLAVAGTAGVVITLAVGAGLVAAVRRGRGRGRASEGEHEHGPARAGVG
ncbi:MAG: energy-coupling factor ABC transporter permease [Actinobacteria bacterium]|nr:energy-coupling factor ABC transporter permease [Actinomycetota bacterium]